MRVIVVSILFLSLVLGSPARSGKPQDVIETSKGDLVITFIGHGSLMFTLSGVTIHVDPWGRQADYGSLPKADIILVSHDHRDHLDGGAIGAVRKEGTVTILTRRCADEGFEGLVMENGDSTAVLGIEIIALPAYNIEQKRGDGSPYHPKGEGNGYLLRFGGTAVYVAGDTEFIPEMEDMPAVDIVFLPMNLPYTMSPEMTAEAARAIKPRILYPYHYGDTDTDRLLELLADEPEIEVRIREM